MSKSNYAGQHGGSCKCIGLATGRGCGHGKQGAHDMGGFVCFVLFVVYNLSLTHMDGMRERERETLKISYELI